MAADDVSVGLKCTAAIPAHLRSCINIVGGRGEADSRTTPSGEIANTSGGEGCVLLGGSKWPIGSE